jgi:molecular chaperone DnaK (HSP70)
MSSGGDAAARFVVGIDLGTTNSVLAFTEANAELAPGASPTIEVLPIPQLTAPGSVLSRPLLPSFLYLAGAREFAANALDLPWRTEATDAVGEMARSQGSQVPGRLVSSAKSWLSHPGVDRTAPILPFPLQPDLEGLQPLSPVEASARYLEHLAAAWLAANPEAPLAQQDVLLTVPASFDAVARELTVRAAEKAGLGHVTLLEEPQAAFYSWLAAAGDGWRRRLKVGDLVLVCDVGGGTTDFTLIAVGEDAGNLTLERVAVGDHILLGGDNMDLALAFALRERLEREGKKLDEWQVRSLTHSCRGAKESLLQDATKDKAAVTVLGRGRSVIGGSIKTELQRADVEELLLGGFFARCAVTDAPQQRRRIGLAELGLPFAADAAVTRHLAHFLSRHGAAAGKGADGAAGFARPTAVLYNGGVMKGSLLRSRLSEVVGGWLSSSGAQAPTELEGTDFDLAVARGAAYYGAVRRGAGVRIRGGTARTYYVGIESSMPAVPGMAPPIKALCVAPQGMEEGTEVELPRSREMSLVIGEPAEFRFLSSSTRKDDVGTLLDSFTADEIQESSPLLATLPETPGAGPGAAAGSLVPVTLAVRVTEVGTLELWCRSREGGRWKLEWNVREKPPGGAG